MNQSNLIIFDCDGTLVESEVIACKIFPKYWATHGIQISVDEFKEKFIGVGNDSEIGRHFFAQMPPHADEEGDRLFAQALSEELQALEGMSDLLSSLNNEMCVASNSSLAHVQIAMRKTGLMKFFADSLFSAKQVSQPKPAPDLFFYASKIMGYDKKNCIVVEDSVSGIKAAQAAGMKVIGFSGASHFTPLLESRLEALSPNWLCKTVKELHECLLKLK